MTLLLLPLLPLLLLLLIVIDFDEPFTTYAQFFGCKYTVISHYDTMHVNTFQIFILFFYFFKFILLEGELSYTTLSWMAICRGKRGKKQMLIE